MHLFIKKAILFIENKQNIKNKISNTYYENITYKLCTIISISFLIVEKVTRHIKFLVYDTLI